MLKEIFSFALVLTTLNVLCSVKKSFKLSNGQELAPVTWRYTVDYDGRVSLKPKDPKTPESGALANEQLKYQREILDHIRRKIQEKPNNSKPNSTECLFDFDPVAYDLKPDGEIEEVDLIKEAEKSKSKETAPAIASGALVTAVQKAKK